MDFVSQIFEWLWKSIAAVGILALGGGYWLSQWRKGSKEGEAEKDRNLDELRKALETANANAEAWKLASERKDQDIAEMRGELSRLKSDIAGLTAKVETYESLLGGKEISPAMAKLWDKFSDSITSEFRALGDSINAQTKQLAKIEEHTRPTRRSRASG